MRMWWDDEQVVLVGHSLGGFANLMLAERFPDKIDLAVFVTAIATPSGVSLTQATTLFKLVSTMSSSSSHLHQ